MQASSGAPRLEYAATIAVNLSNINAFHPHDRWGRDRGRGSDIGMTGSADQGTHSLLGAVKLHECHATGPPISMHHKVDAIRAHSVPGEESAGHIKLVSNSRPS